MSNKSGVSTQVINVPTGGGALSGIGEKFAPDLHTGTGNFSIPIALPSGRNGFQPEINLVYSTGNPNGAFGLGWQLSIPNISRKTSKGVPRYRQDDVFLLSGAEDLVEVGKNGNRTQYRPRTEGLFAIIERVLDDENDYWEVKTKDGMISRYGHPILRARDPENEELGNNNATCRDPKKPDHVFTWMLTETRDPFDNIIRYIYERRESLDDLFPFDYLYCKKIEYVDYPDPDHPGEDKYLVSAEFIYDERERNDIFSEYRAGFEMRLDQRCSKIKVRTHADIDREVRDYRFTYIQDLFTQTSLLKQVEVVGIDRSLAEEEQEQRLPPIAFSYSQFDPEDADFFPVRGMDLPAKSLSNPEIELADLFGNGLPDIVEMNGQIRYWRNLGNGEFDIPRFMKEGPVGVSLEDPQVQFMDANGNGKIDLLVNRSNLSGYYPMQSRGEWDRRSFQRHKTMPSFPLQDPETKLVDLTGNGITDAIRSSSRMECFFNDQLEGWTKTRSVIRKDIDTFPNINFSDPRVKWGDLSGSGLEHPILVYDGNIEYWPSLGYGDFASRVHMKNSPRFPQNFDTRRVIIGDVNGDGLDDLVYVDHCRVLLWINQSGKSWSELIEIEGTPELTDPDAVRLVDLLGNGVVGLLWTQDLGVNNRSNLHFLDLTNGVKPMILHKMDNNMGAITRVAYRSSVQDYIRDYQSLDTHWKCDLPFPVQVVGKVEVIDVFSGGKLTTLYQYHHGYWDGGEREFRGFGMVEQIDSENFELYNAQGLLEDKPFQVLEGEQFTPPTKTKTWFHQGPVGNEFGEWEELDYSNEYWERDGSKLYPFKELKEYQDFSNLMGDADIPRRVKRDAIRSLRGRILRTELFALDGSGRQDRPYTVTEGLHATREIYLDLDSNPSKLHRNSKSIFFPFTPAQRSSQWERGDEPLHQFSITENFDEFGLPTQSTSVACPRGWKEVENIPNPTPDSLDKKDHLRYYLATRSISTYARENLEDVYIKDRLAKSTNYELINQGNQKLWVLVINPPELKLFSHGSTYYDGEAFEGLALGEIGRYGAPVRTESLVITEDILREAYGETLPPYLDLNGLVWTDEYPQEFRDITPALAGYTFYEGDIHHPRGFYAQSSRKKYDFQFGDPTIPAKGLPIITKDALGTETVIEYDSTYHFLPIEVRDAVGLRTSASYDYRIFQPQLITDVNDNQQTFAFTPLGLAEGIAVMGKEGENLGDTLESPGTRFSYDFEAFIDSKDSDSPQPISVHTIQREYHIKDNDPLIPEADRNNTISKGEFSDGFGRILQTRAQAEDVLFGDPLFGEEVISPDQDAFPRPQEIIGRVRGEGDPPNVVVSGWQIYDNKGQVIIKFEPFYSQDFGYLPPGEAERGRKIRVFFDALSRSIKTLNQDDSEQLVIYGIPNRLDAPLDFKPCPWEAYSYDENDNAFRTHRSGDSSHFDTPSNTIIDALGRTVENIIRNGNDEQEDWYHTNNLYDIRGNLLEVEDAFERKAFTYLYDLTFDKENGSQIWKTDNIDAGVRRKILDVVGNEVEHRDAKDSLVLNGYDILHRPLFMWARDDLSDPMRLCGIMIYGDGSSNSQAATARRENRNLNLLGRLTIEYDEAGKCVYDAYDFKGNLLEKIRIVISDEAIISVFEGWDERVDLAPFRVDWQSINNLSQREEVLLEEKIYQISSIYDGLNRLKQMTYPEDVEGKRKQLIPLYNRAGALKNLSLHFSSVDLEEYVKHIAYNANGQRSMIALGNGIVTAHAYDERFRLKRLFSAAYQKTNSFEFIYEGKVLQDYGYTYDWVSNVLAIRHTFPGSGVKGANELNKVFKYDPIYRLVFGTGRENDRDHNTPPWLKNNVPNNDPNLTCGYEESYQYDKLGNVLRLLHYNVDCDIRTGFSRNFTMNGASAGATAINNQLQSMKIGIGESKPTYNCIYDLNGNMIQEGCTRHFLWDHNNRMKAFVNQIKKVNFACRNEQLLDCKGDFVNNFAIENKNGKTSIYGCYLYDKDGLRVKKLVRCQGGKLKTTIYIDEIFEYKKKSAVENNIVHIFDGQKRIAFLRIGNSLNVNDLLPRIQFQIEDHRNNSNVVVGGDGNWTNREEYTPFGEISFGGFLGKKYRFTNKENDAESNLNYHQNRYYNSIQIRWMSTDPIGINDGINLYLYVRNNPVSFIDPSGLWFEAIVFEGPSIILGAVSFADNVSEGNVGGAILDAAGIAVDVGAALVPGVPGGAGYVIKAGRATNRATDAIQAVRVAERASDSAKAARQADRASDASRASSATSRPTSTPGSSRGGGGSGKKSNGGNGDSGNNGSNNGGSPESPREGTAHASSEGVTRSPYQEPGAVEVRRPSKKMWSDPSDGATSQNTPEIPWSENPLSPDISGRQSGERYSPGDLDSALDQLESIEHAQRHDRSGIEDVSKSRQNLNQELRRLTGTRKPKK